MQGWCEDQCVWLLHWCMTNVGPAMMAVTFNCRLQIHHHCWLLHWCTTKVRRNAPGCYTGFWIQIHHSCWLLHWCKANATPNAHDYYTGFWITNSPWGLVVTLMQDQCNTQQPWLLHWLLDYKFAMGVGCYINVRPM